MCRRFPSLACLFALLLALLVAGCASGGDRDGDTVQGRFITDIRPGDIRLFRFVVALPEQPVHAITQLNQGSQHRRQRYNLETERLAVLEKVLARQPQLKEYCPHGYNVIDKYAVLNEVVIRGECKYQD